jgi:hypothetical protein
MQSFRSYPVARKSEDSRYKELAVRLKRKPTERVGVETRQEQGKRRRA